MPRVILAGDVGGTNTRLALYEPGAPARRPARQWRGASGDYPSLEALLAEFLDGGPPPAAAAFGIAGPVVDGRCEATNLAWWVDSRALGAALGIPRVVLLNDLAATGVGLGALGDGELEVLQRGAPRDGNRALIAAGTGLGESVLLPDRFGGWRPMASEGGHSDFGPRDPLEDELLVWLRARYGRVSWERVLSGPGLADLYRFLSDTGRGEEPDGFAAAFASAEDPAPLVTQAALAGGHARARLAVERFVSLYGSEAGNLALQSLAVNGLYVGGGIAPRMLPFLRAPAFVDAFRAKGRLADLVAAIPLIVVLDDRAALWGAATVAQQAYGNA
jgi:glucokinase